MKVLVVGANGQIGKELVKMIQATETLQAKAMIRHKEQAAFFEDLGAETVIVDLEHDTPVIQEAFDGVDAVIFTAGSGPSTGADKTMLIDLDGAVKTIKAAELAQIDRFIMVSSFDTTRDAIQEASSSFAPYVVAKHYADEWLRSTNLAYTIVHPGLLTNDKATGKIKAATKLEGAEIPRGDVAHILLECITNESTIGKEFQVVTGETPISDAINAL